MDTTGVDIGDPVRDANPDEYPDKNGPLPLILTHASRRLSKPAPIMKCYLDINLYYVPCMYEQNFCGDFVQALCPQNGCPDTAGDYDVLFPEPVGGNTSDGYVVRLQDVYAEADDAECSAPFTLVSSENMPVEGEQGGATLEVLLPGVNNNFTAGEDGVIEVCVRARARFDKLNRQHFREIECRGYDW